MAVPHSTFTQVLAATAYKRLQQKGFADNIFNGLRTLGLMVEQGGKERLDGGNSIIVPLEYAENTSAEWIAPYGQYNLSPQDNFTAAEFDWKSVAGTITHTQKEAVQNSGEAQMLNLISAKFKNLEKTLRKRLSQAFFNDGTNVLQPAGLDAIITTSGTLGGISKTAQTWWAANVDATAEVFDPADLDTLYNNCTHNLDEPTLIVMTQALYEYYGQIAQTYATINKSGNAGTADLGFSHYTFRDKPVIWDSDVPSGTVYLLNWNYLKVYVHEDWEFRPGEMKESEIQPLWRMPITWWGGFCPSNNRMLGAMRNKTTS